MANGRTEPEPEERARPAGEGGGRSNRSLWLWIIGLLLLVVVGVYAWKEIQVGNVRGEAEERRQALVERAGERVDQRTRNLLRLSAQPLGWAVRSEMIRRNLDQVDAYLTDFVQEEGVESAVLAGERDSVLIATDRRFQGARFSDHLPAELLERDETAVEATDDERLRIVVPIMGINQRLGTLVVFYRPEEVRLEDEPEEVRPEEEPSQQ